MKNSISILIAVMISICLFVSNSFGQNTKSNKPNQSKTDTVKTIYMCPMHPEVISAKPGKCSKCGMDLVKQEKKSDKIVYTCPMHPEIKSDKPGKCSKCGMDLVKQENGVKTMGHGCCKMH